MKSLIDYGEEIHKCSKCGLCQSVCPVYEQTGNDCSVSRGKFIMLNGVVKGDLKLNKNINKYLDMCLKCNACKNFCPSAIDARKIFTTAKAQYFEKTRNSPSIFLRRVVNSALVFHLVMKMSKLATHTYRFFGLDKLVKKFYPILLKMGELGKKVILANEFASINVVGQVCPNYGHNLESRSGIPARQQKVVYFKGCVNEYINPRSKLATENILKKLGVKILKTHLPLQCCGVPFLSGGNVEQFKKQAEFNLGQIPEEFDYFLTDCASCQNAFFEYENCIEDEKLLAKLKKINEKSINVVDFVLQQVQSIEFNEKTTFTFHKPCHLENINFIKEFMKKAKNVEYVEMDEFDKCCGFSGEFAINNVELSQKISAKKAKNALKTQADYILTSCPACMLGLTQGIIEANMQRTVKSRENCSTIQPFNLSTFIEFIGKADKIC